MGKKNKFIGGFVNEFYGLLLGFGLANIIFDSGFKITLFEIVMVFAVTFLVLMYWWDWSEYIEDDVSSTKRELIIDFILLFTELLLFLNYNNPFSLAINLMFLGVCDLLWVINYIYEKTQEGEGHSINIAAWIGEKFLVIGLYGLAFLLIILTNFYQEQLSFDITQWIHGILIILSMYFARTIGFSHVKKEKMMFSRATLADIDEILEINQSYLNSKTKEGFLIGEYSKEKLSEAIETNPDRFFIATGDDKEILGYIDILTEIDAEILNEIKWNWNDKKDKNNFENNPYCYINQVAVKRGNRERGIGRFLYENAFKYFPDKNFTAFVVNKPFRNEASEKFHQKLGFDDIGKFNSPNYAGISNYRSIFFFKKKK